MEPRTFWYYLTAVSFVLVSLILTHQLGSASDAFTGGEVSSKVDADLFLEDEGSGHGRDDLESHGSGNGEDDEDSYPDTIGGRSKTPKKEKGFGDYTPSGGSQDPTFIDPSRKDITNAGGGGGPPHDIFNTKEGSGSFFSQPGILAAIICGAIVGLLCAILLVMFIVYRMRKKDEGSYVLEDSKRATTTYGKSKEFYA